MQQDHAEEGMAEQPMGLPPQGMAAEGLRQDRRQPQPFPRHHPEPPAESIPQPSSGMAIISPKSPACERRAARRGAAGLNRLITG